MEHRKYAVIAVLDEVCRTTGDVVLRGQVARAALALQDAPADPTDPEFVSAYQQGRILVERHQHLCLNSPSTPVPDGTHC